MSLVTTNGRAVQPARELGLPEEIESSIVRTQGNDLASMGSGVKSEIDTQVLTAKRFPRSISAFIRDATQWATMSTEIARSCTYTLPQGGKPISGPSIRLAEIVAGCWTNLSIQTRFVDDDGRTAKVEATCWDMERNTTITLQATRRLTDKNGRRYSDDVANKTINAALAIVFRNAVFKVIPAAFVSIIHESAKQTAAGSKETFVDQVMGWVDYWKQQKISTDRLLKTLDVARIEDMTVDHLTTMQGMYEAIQAKATTLADMFADQAPVDRTPGQTKAAALGEQLAAQVQPKKPATILPESDNDDEEWPDGKE
jgi:hypothetical protein